MLTQDYFRDTWKKLGKYLNENEYELICKIGCFVEKLLNLSEAVEISERNEKEIKIAVLNVEQIIQLLSECAEKKQKFLKYFPEWEALRTKNVNLLNEIGKTINKDRRNSNISKLVGSSTSLVGGAICVAASAMIPFSFGLTTPVAVGGAMLTAVGSATTVGTSITEIVLLKHRINDAKEILGKDAAAFKPTREWMQSSHDLVEVMELILGFDLMQKIIYDINKFFLKVKEMHLKIIEIFDSKRGRKIMQDMLNKLITELKLNLEIPCKQPLQIIIIVISVIFASFLMRNEANFILSSVVVTCRIACGLGAVLDLGVDATSAIVSTARSTGGVMSKSIGRAVVRGSLSALGVALDVANIAVTSIDVRKGSVSEQGRQIMEAAEKMKMELDMLQSIYRELSR